MSIETMLGLGLHWIGGLAAASFYVPYRSVRGWNWEILWITGGIFSWILAPWAFAALQVPQLLNILAATPTSVLLSCFVLGVLWGVGGLTYGLTMRYLGLSLGMVVVIGVTTAFGTLLPPILSGEFASRLIENRGGNIILLGILITLAGFYVVALAGHRKERDGTRDAATIQEFNFPLGMLIGVFSGVMSSFFALAIARGEPIRVEALAQGTPVIWQGLPVLCVILAGGAMTNLIWCGYLIAKNRTAPQFVGRSLQAVRASIPINYLLCALAGTTWYVQLVFYTMGETKMGKYGFTSWTLHMASYIIFGTIWGYALKEWVGAPPAVKRLLWSGVIILLGATVTIGMGNALS